MNEPETLGIAPTEYDPPAERASYWQRAARMALTYTWHGSSQPMCERVKGESYPCTCGLDDLRKAIGEAQ